MLSILPLICAIVLTVACCAAQAFAGKPDLARDLEALLQQQRLAGAVVATVNGSRSDMLALGVFHTGTGQRLKLSDRVQVGSIAKTVLSLAMLRLVSQGRVDLDAPLSALLPGVRLDNPWAARSPVRLRHLLDMTAGLPDLDLWHMFNQHHTAQQPLARALRSEQGSIGLRSEPGRQFSYSNLSFTLVGMVIEAVTGERYESWAARELLQPLGMAHSTFEFRRQGAEPTLAWGHMDDGQAVADWPVAVRPATQFTTTAADMLRLIRFILDGGHINGQVWVHGDLMDGLGWSTTADATHAGLRTGYGLGMFTRDRHGAVGLCHGGSAAGWRAMFCVFRATQQGFFVSLNQDREGANYGLFDARLVQQLGLAGPHALPAAASARPGDSEWNGLYVPAPGRLQSLALADRLLGFWWLDLTPGRSTLREGLGPTRQLIPAGNGLYRQADRQQASLALLRDDQGRPKVGGSYLSLRRVGLWEQALLWTSAVIGALGVLALLPLALWRAWQHGLRAASSRVPAAWALLLLATALAFWALQGWQRMAEFTPATMAVAVTSVLLALACVFQLLQAWRHRLAWAGTAWDAWPVLATLQGCGLLAAYGWLPLLPWRL